MSDDITRIEHIRPHALKVGYVDWRLGNTCNYQCSYCPPYENSGSFPWIDIETNIKTQNIIIEGYKSMGKSTSFAYTGGEPTVYKHFSELLENGKKQGAFNWVYTNGSRTVRYWNDIKDVLDMACISYHAEYDKGDHIIEVVEAIKKDVFLSVNVVMHPLQLDKCFNFLDKFKAAHPEVTLDTKIVRVLHGDPLHPDYTPENVERVLAYKQTLNTRPRQTVNKPFLGKSVTMKLTEPGQEPRLISCQEEILKGLNGFNDFNDWECYIGVESLMIDFDGKVYKGYCQMDGSIGTIPNFEVPKEPVICHYGDKRCTCNLDFATTKYSKPNKTFYFKQI
jgi:MoaA/NifB/PqqE/SkfB family radical SAM enzyme